MGASLLRNVRPGHVSAAGPAEEGAAGHYHPTGNGRGGGDTELLVSCFFFFFGTHQNFSVKTIFKMLPDSR